MPSCDLLVRHVSAVAQQNDNNDCECTSAYRCMLLKHNSMGRNHVRVLAQVRTKRKREAGNSSASSFSSLDNSKRMGIYTRVTDVENGLEKMSPRSLSVSSRRKVREHTSAYMSRKKKGGSLLLRLEFLLQIFKPGHTGPFQCVFFKEERPEEVTSMVASFFSFIPRIL